MYSSIKNEKKHGTSHIATFTPRLRNWHVPFTTTGYPLDTETLSNIQQLGKAPRDQVYLAIRT